MSALDGDRQVWSQAAMQAFCKPHLRFETPTAHYRQSENAAVVMLPAEDSEFEVAVAPRPPDRWVPKVARNRAVLPPGLPVGDYVFKARWRPPSGEGWSAWTPLKFTVHPDDADLAELRRREHRLSLMVEQGVGGAITVTDPNASPPACPDDGGIRWFATPCYEGATMLLNEEEDFYRDPLAYYLDCIDRLIAQRVQFVTWHDLLDDKSAPTEKRVLLQFDIDGGPKSMHRLYVHLRARGVRGSIMVHRRGHYWYSQDIYDVGIDWIREAESSGWTIGFHNNALSQSVGERERVSRNDLGQAERVFEKDVADLRRYFDIRTFTHHGGNITNNLIHAPGNLAIVGVDRQNAPRLWSNVASMFSDGGFVARPCSLRRKVEALGPGLHFFRNHPFKYANYEPPVDVPPRNPRDWTKADLVDDAATRQWVAAELVKERQWLGQRRKTRAPMRLSSLRLETPISGCFHPYRELEARVEALRSTRRESFLRQYPWAPGDPRVFWWRMLHAWAANGDVLNVGALPPDQKAEIASFLPEARLMDMDVDASREPNYHCDVVAAPAALDGCFDRVLLFGLPYFARPSEAVAACARLVKPGGIGLFGFAADTNPARGSIWHPHNRHTWSKKREPLTDLGLKGNLWAFDEEGLGDLFESWDHVQFEFMNHYWFAVACRNV